MRTVVVVILVLGLHAASRGDSLWIAGAAVGMGINAISVPDVVDYINGMSGSAERFDDFASAAEFFGSVTVRAHDSWGAKVEYVYIIKSYSVGSAAPGAFDFSYGIHLPTIVMQYLDVYANYLFKLGLGAGYHVATFSEQLRGSPAIVYRSSGLGVKVEAEANTALGKNVFAILAGAIRANFMSALKNRQGRTIPLGSPPEAAAMNFVALGLHLGIAYYF